MNQNLQKISDFIEKSEILSAEEKVSLAKAVKDTDSALTITEFKLERTEKVKRTTAILLEETIEELEQKRKAVEAQNRDLEIESSLERVRTVAMGMRKPDDMLEVCRIISQQSESLGIKEIRNVQTAIIYEDKGTYLNYEYYAKHEKLLVTEVNFRNHELQSLFANQMLRGAEELFTRSLKGKEVQDWYQYQQGTNQYIDSFLETAESLSYYWYSLGSVALGMSTYVPLSDEEISLFKRFRNVFDLAYRRFLDIEKAAAQAREARIELALERVRARTMAMQKSEELSEVAYILFQQFKELGEIPLQITIGIIHEPEKSIEFSITGSDGTGAQINRAYTASIDEPALIHKLFKAWKVKKKSVSIELAGNELEGWVNYRNSISGTIDNSDYSNARRVVSAGFFSSGLISISTLTMLPGETIQLLERFAGVFDITYTRFNDLKLAEAQAREAQIELALERVRARTMAMQKSEELSEAVYLLFQQFRDLGENPDQATIGIINEKEHLVEYWVTMYGNQVNKVFKFSIDEPHVTGKIYKAWKEHKKSMVVDLSGKALTEFMAYRAALGGAAINSNEKRRIINVAFFSKGLLNVQSSEPRSNDSMQLLERFAKVFEQTYTRFLDLQKAESQARESQIEASLERVRSKAMSMHKSEDLRDAVAVVFEEMDKLDIGVLRVGISVLNEDKRCGNVWLTSIDEGKAVQVSGDEPFDIHPLLQGAFEAWLRQEDFSYLLEGEDLTKYYQAVETARFRLPASQMLLSVTGPRQQHCFVAVYNSGGLFAFRETAFPEEAKAVMKRFAGVFDLTYKRFLDLQKAEAQARQAQIELSLERVRARSMAMHKSEELVDTSIVLFNELKNIGITAIRTGVATVDNENEKIEIWSSQFIEQNEIRILGMVPKNIHPFFEGYYESWQRKDPYFTYEISGEDLRVYYKSLSPVLSYPKKKEYNSKETFSVFFFPEGSLNVVTIDALTEDQCSLVIRFAIVFGHIYTRFLDLKKAEAQARESKIEAALERVRSRTMAMQKSDELAETSAVLFQQLIQLGIEPNRLYITIIKDDQANAEFWITDEDGSKVSSAFETNLNNNPVFKKMLNGWKGEKHSLTIDMKGEELQEYFRYLSSLHVPFKGGLAQTRRIQYLGYFNKGFIGMASPVDQPEETIQLLVRFAAVFNLTFTRFNDLKIAEAHAIQAEEDLVKLQTEKQRAEEALAELQVTQKQLIQAEKMASLGELTAGIAHEIQNPLNFVNNFSEVNTELIDELEQEVDKGNLDEVKAIAKDIRENEQKILHHGKRADAIVKGMLQHSRSSSGIKEPTDINALADEYLRLAYHGLRAKDKSFNATLKTDFDESIGKIDIIPQDIGRVILNLITNAFYAVDEKKKQQSESYKPTVMVTTQKSGAKVLISVKDNGNGIPKKVQDKIFQPFFTTKPTGEGTGLGLSLVYDIVKVHGGELNVKTNEGQGTEFIVSLPDSERKL